MPEGLVGYARSPFYAIDTPQMKEVRDKISEQIQRMASRLGNHGVRRTDSSI